MPVIRLRTALWRPDRTITVRAAPDWNDDVPGEYQFGMWTFTLPQGPPLPRAFKFVLDYTTWQNGENNAATSPDVNDYTEGQVAFADGSLPDAESGVISRTFFAPDLTPNAAYDVIVIGSGAGGGILADALSDRGVRTLVLEAGSYLFPTHVSNLPHAHRVGQFDKHVWGLWNNEAFRHMAYINEGAGSAYAGGGAYCLGGRSVFWGGLTPRMRDYEFEAPAWPASVRAALLDGPDSSYDRAERLMKVGPARPSAFQDKTKAWLAATLGEGVTVSDAPMAVETQASERRTLSAGVFSTADLLFESRATAGASGNQNLVINLNNEVRRLGLSGDRVTSVVAYDRLDRQERSYTARDVVLAAGSLESPRIALQSGLSARDASGRLGAGLTDHQLWYVHFGVRDGAVLFARDASAKVLVQRVTAATTEGGWNAVLELGADMNQGRYVDEDILSAHVAQRGKDAMVCELVFLTACALVDQNYVRPGGGEDGRPIRVHMERSTRANAMLAEMNAVKDKILGGLGAYALPCVRPHLLRRPARRSVASCSPGR
jgi:hypothetical protein